MARHLIRALGGMALAGACIALAACTSSSAGGSGSAAKADGVPVKSGTVTVKEGNKVICVMTVVNGKGTCKVPASSIGVGTQAIVGQYTGAGYGQGDSNPVNVSVTKAPASVALSVSPATMTYGDEQAVHVTVRVTAAAATGVPTGSVLVKSGGTTVCTISLAHGAGSCALGPRVLKAGSRTMYASYSGDGNHDGSGSALVKVTVSG